MSDGPHYSLNARKKWKKTAEIADNNATSIGEVCDMISDAVKADFVYEKVGDAVEMIKSILTSGELSLFPESPHDQLDRLKDELAGNELAVRVVEFTQNGLQDGLAHEEAVIDGVKCAGDERVDRELRSMEEHYLRSSDQGRAFHLRDKMNNAISNLSMRDVVQGYLAQGSSSKQNSYQKKTNIDEGVSL